MICICFSQFILCYKKIKRQKINHNYFIELSPQLSTFLQDSSKLDLPSISSYV